MQIVSLITALLAINVPVGVGYTCYRYLQDRVEARGRVVRVYPGRPNYEWRSISASSVVESRSLQPRAGRRDRDNQEKDNVSPEEARKQAIAARARDDIIVHAFSRPTFPWTAARVPPCS